MAQTHFKRLDTEGRALHENWDDIARLTLLVAVLAVIVWACCTALRELVHLALHALFAASEDRGTAGMVGPDAETYRQLLTAIGEGHALLNTRATDIRQREVAREILAQEDRLRRLMLILAPDPAVGLRPDPAGAVGAVVQP